MEAAARPRNNWAEQVVFIVNLKCYQSAGRKLRQLIKHETEEAVTDGIIDVVRAQACAISGKCD